MENAVNNTLTIQLDSNNLDDTIKKAEKLRVLLLEVKELLCETVLDAARMLSSVADENEPPTETSCSCEHKKEIKLKPCPFCGSHNVSIIEPHGDDMYTRITCDDCDVMLKFMSEHSSVKAAGKWNTRNV